MGEEGKNIILTIMHFKFFNEFIVKDFQAKTNTFIQISTSKNHFPGTHDRIGRIEGEYEDVRDCLNTIFESIKRVYLF